MRLAKGINRGHGAQGKGRNDFESSVGVLFYMLGFELVHIGAVRKLSDGPDIYALAPQRDALVVECTAAAFNEDKLERLTGKFTDICGRLAAIEADRSREIIAADSDR